MQILKCYFCKALLLLMALIKSISGIRGTIGGKTGENLTPNDVVKFTSSYGDWLKSKNSKKELKVVVGRDARISGEMVNKLVCATLQAMGISVVDLGLSTTPTVEIAVPEEKAQGGIVITASHNPKEWSSLNDCVMGVHVLKDFLEKMMKS